MVSVAFKNGKKSDSKSVETYQEPITLPRYTAANTSVKNLKTSTTYLFRHLVWLNFATTTEMLQLDFLSGLNKIS